jgi:hypothetical protein
LLFLFSELPRLLDLRVKAICRLLAQVAQIRQASRSDPEVVTVGRLAIIGIMLLGALLILAAQRYFANKRLANKRLNNDEK